MGLTTETAENSLIDLPIVLEPLRILLFLCFGLLDARSIRLDILSSAAGLDRCGYPALSTETR